MAMGIGQTSLLTDDEIHTGNHAVHPIMKLFTIDFHRNSTEDGRTSRRQYSFIEAVDALSMAFLFPDLEKG